MCSEEAAGTAVKFSDLFRDGLDTLAVYSFTYGPEMKQPCPMCTAFLDSLNALPRRTLGSG